MPELLPESDETRAAFGDKAQRMLGAMDLFAIFPSADDVRDFDPDYQALVREFIKQQLSPQRMSGILGEGKTAYTILPEWGKFPLKEITPKKLKPGTVLNLVTFKRASDNYSLIQKELQALGIEVNLIVLPFNDFCKANSLKEADLVYYGEMISEHMILSLFEYFARISNSILVIGSQSFFSTYSKRLATYKCNRH